MVKVTPTSKESETPERWRWRPKGRETHHRRDGSAPAGSHLLVGVRPIRLPVMPRLESWNAATHPDQVRLRAYLVQAATSIEDRLRGEGQLTFDLAVGLPPGASGEP